MHQGVAAPELELRGVVAAEALVRGLLGRGGAGEPGVQGPGVLVDAGDDREQVGVRLLDADDHARGHVATGAARERGGLVGGHGRRVHQAALADHATHVDLDEQEATLGQRHLADGLLEQVLGLGVRLEVLQGALGQRDRVAAGGVQNVLHFGNLRRCYYRVEPRGSRD